MGVHRISSSDVRAQFPAGTVLHNPVSGEYARVVEHTPERVVGELLAVPGAAVAGPHSHPGQEERFEVLDGVMGSSRLSAGRHDPTQATPSPRRGCPNRTRTSGLRRWRGRRSAA